MAEPLARALSACNYITPTPIQTQAIPPQIENRDILALAETGSGKTAAFVLPILNQLAKAGLTPQPRSVLALILAPTRELALQIDAEVAALSRFMNVRHAVVLGGVSKGPQINALKRGVHVLVATPGRLLDHVMARHADLRGVHMLVIDEADRMFDMGFIRDIKKIVAMLPHQRRTALFSATMPTEIRTLAHELLKDPARIDLSPKQIVVDRIDQKVMVVRTPEKQSRLHTLLADPACQRVIVFTRTKRGADRVADRLGMAGIGAVAIHGNKAQNARQRALSDFAAGHMRVLVATDIAARGIDVANVTHVINFEMPVEPETYVHRIGRTARKGESGIAISLCDPAERDEIRAIERLIKTKIDVIEDVGGEPVAMAERKPRQQQDKRRPEGRNQERQHREGRTGARSASDGRGERPHAARERDGVHPTHRPREGEGELRSHRPREGEGELRSHRPREGEGEHRSHRPREAHRPADRADGRRRDDAPGERARSGWVPNDRPDRGSRPHDGGRARTIDWRSGSDGGRSGSDGGRNGTNRGPAHPGGERHPRRDGEHREARPQEARHNSDQRRNHDGAPRRHDGPHEARGHKNGPSRPHHDQNGGRPRTPESANHHGARTEGPRDARHAPHGGKAHHGKPRHEPRGGEAVKTGGNWDGQQPPKFLKQRRRGNASA